MASSGLQRDTIDKFYTSSDAVVKCLGIFTEEVKCSRDDTVLEPSAGNGSFLQGLKALSDNAVFYDIQPEHPDVTQQDYLELDTKDLLKKRVHVIGNPPFGRQSSLAIKFIRKSATFASTISFILPKSFKKQSFRSKFPLCYHLVSETDLSSDSFLLGGKPHDVPCVFQIWERRDIEREVEEKEDPCGYEFVKKHETPDIAVRRVGFYTGKVNTEIDDKSTQSHYFIRFTERNDLEEKIKKVSEAEFNGKDNTVGARSISKGEVVKEFNKKLIR